MPWMEASVMSLREEFVVLASHEDANRRALCRRYRISPTTGYKWLARYRCDGRAGLVDRTRRPHANPNRTAPAVEAQVVTLRDQHPVWGGRKLRTVLAARAKHTAGQRFESPTPNHTWQMDFKGHFPLARGRCHPLTVLDDHSRVALAVAACADEAGPTVRAILTALFRRFGLPQRLLADNGPPWSAGGQAWTPLTVWLLRIGVPVSHGRPSHPQTQGKDERFNRTLKAEAITGRTFPDLTAAQTQFDDFRATYNLIRPHEALGMATPGSRYQPSARPFPETLPPIEYGPSDLVRKVQDKGEIWVKGKPYHVSTAFHGESIALRPTTDEVIWEVFYGHQRLMVLDLTQPCE